MKKLLTTGDVLFNSPGMGETRPCRVRAPSRRISSGPGGGRDGNTSASHRSQDGGGGTGFRDKHVTVNRSSSNIYAA